MEEAKDPMGTAIADYYKNGKAGRLRVFSPDFDEDEIPVDLLFRYYADMPALEQHALQMANGRILDAGAGAGCHSLALQEMGKDVTAIDISPLSIKTMQARGVQHAILMDFWNVTETYDTILMLMNGIGIVGTLAELPRFFQHISNLLSQGGQLILDSSDISYIFEENEEEYEEEEDDGNLDAINTIVNTNEAPSHNANSHSQSHSQSQSQCQSQCQCQCHNQSQSASDTDLGIAPPYYGELQYQMQYKRIKGNEFSWLYIDFPTLSRIANECGFKAELLQEGSHYDYLARITKCESNKQV